MREGQHGAVAAGAAPPACCLLAWDCAEPGLCIVLLLAQLTIHPSSGGIHARRLLLVLGSADGARHLPLLLLLLGPVRGGLLGTRAWLCSQPVGLVRRCGGQHAFKGKVGIRVHSRAGYLLSVVWCGLHKAILEGGGQCSSS